MKRVYNLSKVIVLMFVFASCTGQVPQQKEGAIAQNVDTETFESKLKESQLLDVRTPEEWSEGIIEGAIMLNYYEDDFDSKLAQLDKEKPVAVYCKSGGRSGGAMTKMNELGFKEVYNLDGGITEWNSKGKPTVQP